MLSPLRKREKERHLSYGRVITHREKPGKNQITYTKITQKLLKAIKIKNFIAFLGAPIIFLSTLIFSFEAGYRI